MKKYKKMIAPKLANGKSRVAFGARFPEEFKEGIRHIAYDERKSMSWVMEEAVLDYFGFKRPKYTQRRKKNEFDKKARTNLN